MKKSLSRMNTNELRDLAVELGADRKKLYGTSKQSLIAGEWVINQTMAELVIQQEYIREREKANWGWSRKVVDFSGESCIL